jgi:hypothetical protein
MEEDDLWEGGKNARCLAALQCAGEGAANIILPELGKTNF